MRALWRWGSGLSLMCAFGCGNTTPVPAAGTVPVLPFFISPLGGLRRYGDIGALHGMRIIDCSVTGGFVRPGDAPCTAPSSRRIASDG